MKITQNITLDIEDLVTGFCAVTVKQNDNATREICAALTRRGTPYVIPAGTDAKIRCVKPDGTFCQNDAVVDPEKGTVTFLLTEQMVACPGKVKADIALSKGNQLLSSAVFYIQVEAVPNGEEKLSTNQFLELEHAVRDSKEAVTAANQAADRAASETGKIRNAAESISRVGVTAAAGCRISVSENTVTLSADSAESACLDWREGVTVSFAAIAEQIQRQITENDFVASLAGVTVSADGRTLCAEFIHGNTMLVFNTTSQTFRIAQSAYPLAPEDVAVLVYRSYEFVDGSLYRQYCSRESATRHNAVYVSPLAEISVEGQTMTFDAEDANAEFFLADLHYLRFEDVPEMLPDISSIRKHNGRTALSITVRANWSLLFDTGTGRFHMEISTLTFGAKEIVCIQARTGGLTGGCLYDQFSSNAAIGASKKFNELFVSPLAKFSVDGLSMTIDADNGNAEFFVADAHYLRFDDAAAMIPDHASVKKTGDRTALTLTVPANYSLLFNGASGQFHVEITTASFQRGDIVCLQARTGGFTSGCLYEQYAAARATADSAVAEYDWQQKTREFTALFHGTEEIDSFLFFSDPHFTYFHNWPAMLDTLMSRMGTMYAHNPVSFCISGGDWLGDRDTQEEACYKLGVIDGKCRSTFPEFLPLAGNHDTNYQGADGRASMLSLSTQRNLMFRKEGAGYYKYQAPCAMIYALDTQTDDPAMTDYGWQQLKWLGAQLLQDQFKHSFITMHIALNKLESRPFTDELVTLIRAYNGRTTASVNGQTFHYGGAKGTIHFILAGHDHSDYSTVLNGVPIILTEATVLAENDPQPHELLHDYSFDLCLADYTNHVLHCVRCGYGSNRDIPMIPTIA